MLPHARPLLGAVLALAATAAAGCGSSSSTAGTTTAAAAPKAAAPKAAAPAAAPAPSGPVLTKAAFVRRADKVCTQADAVSHSANAVLRQAFAANDRNRAATAIDTYTPLYAQHVAELKALRAPARDAKILTGLLKVMDRQVLALRAESIALRRQDDAALQNITKDQQQTLQFAEALGRRYGFKVCGRTA